MTPTLQQESERLVRSWMRHDETLLRNYLVADVEDPRLNVQSVLSRHFLAFELTGDRLARLAEEELRFAACLNWMLALSKDGAANPEALLHGLRVGADNGEGTGIPVFLAETFRRLPVAVAGCAIPNYVESILSAAAARERLDWPPPELDLFEGLWRQVLAVESPGGLTAIEPACGSANDYRFLDRYGLARLIRYTGFDLCESNVANARRLFPAARFETGNIFAIEAADRSVDLGIVHDLFEHLSPEGLERATAELCRVIRSAACVGFFNMEEMPVHLIRPVDDYHWNRLSMARLRERFVVLGFDVQVIHVGTYLRSRVGCRTTHNDGAYTFVLERRDEKRQAGPASANEPDRGRSPADESDR